MKPEDYQNRINIWIHIYKNIGYIGANIHTII